jgi:hypothetical protein
MMTDLKPSTDKLLASFSESIWKHFGAAIDMFENAVVMCPEKFWDKPQFWYKAFHASFWLDYYMTVKPDGFSPPPPFTTSEFDPAGKMPERRYTKEEILFYVRSSRKKLHDIMKNMNAETALKRWINPDRNCTYFEMLLHNMRHLQHHTAQLNLLLRQSIDNAPPWVEKTEMSL